MYVRRGIIVLEHHFADQRPAKAGSTTAGTLIANPVPQVDSPGSCEEGLSVCTTFVAAADVAYLSDSSFAKSSCRFSLISRWTRSSISRS